MSLQLDTLVPPRHVGASHCGRGTSMDCDFNEPPPEPGHFCGSTLQRRGRSPALPGRSSDGETDRADVSATHGKRVSRMDRGTSAVTKQWGRVVQCGRQPCCSTTAAGCESENTKTMWRRTYAIPDAICASCSISVHASAFLPTWEWIRKI